MEFHDILAIEPSPDDWQSGMWLNISANYTIILDDFGFNIHSKWLDL
jgi:hypothetical protein